jgi:hypothetical protein
LCMRASVRIKTCNYPFAGFAFVDFKHKSQGEGLGLAAWSIKSQQ